MFALLEMLRTFSSSAVLVIRWSLFWFLFISRCNVADLIIRNVVGPEFINLISSESNEVCNKEDKRTIAPEHVLKALHVLGFGEYVEEVYSAYEQHKYETMVKWSITVHYFNSRPVIKKKIKDVIVCFLRFLRIVQQDSQRSVKMNTGAEMTEEEAAAEQQRMFAEARARMNGGGVSVPQPEQQLDTQQPNLQS